MNSLKQVLIACCFALTISLLGSISSVTASPAAPGEIRLVQPDGRSTLPARAWGDEWSNGYETLDGYTILQDPTTGWWVYAWAGTDGSLSASSPAGKILRVGSAGSIVPEGLDKHLRPIADEASTRLRNTPQAELITAGEYHLPPASGDMPVLVLLAKFTDINETYPSSEFEQLVFGATDSLKSYYSEVSYGALNLVPAGESCGTPDDGVTDWTTLAYAHPNTAASTSEANLQITKDILIASDGCIDYAGFDTNLDGGLSADELQIIVVVAGWERAYGIYSAPSIWAHSFYLDFVEPPSLDGTVIGSYYQQSYYAQIGEIHGTGVYQHPATLGILAHEFGHLLNWPDLYDIDGSTEGVGRWSIMGSGGWNQTGAFAGDTPAHPDAWLKWYQDWLDPIEVTGSIYNAQIAQAEDHPVAFLLRPNTNGIDWIFNYHTGRGEYFLVENRQQSLSDSGLPGCGLLVWHVNERLTFSNYANAAEAYPLVELIQADGRADLKNKINRGDAGDPYPGEMDNHLLSLASMPDSRLQNNGISGVTLQVNASECGTTMGADLTYHLEKYTLVNIKKADASCNAWETIFSEDFEDGVMDDWVAVDKNGTENGEYYPAVSNCRAAQGTHSTWMIGGGADGSRLGCGAQYPDQAIPWMYYGPFSTVGESSIRLDFSHWTYVEPAIPMYLYDRQCVWATQDKLHYYGYCISGDWGGWYDYTFYLKDPRGFYNFMNQPQVWLVLGLMTDEFIHFPEGGYVDDITLSRCIYPTGVTMHNPITIWPGSTRSAFLDSLVQIFQWPKPNTPGIIIGPLVVRRPVGE